jgi:Ni/Fe-hydrogenase subunit HybB-like protein
MTKFLRSKFSFWGFIYVLILIGAAVALFDRYYYGLGGATNLSDKFPWGIWKGFNVVTGIALAAGGFTLAACVHIFNIKSWRPVLRPTILLAFLGYAFSATALLIDIGQSWRIWHPIVMWNPHSVLFEIAWCVMLYLTVLFFEFAPVWMEHFGWTKAIKILRMVNIPLVTAGVLISTMHQSSLGSLFLIVPYRLYALWYTPMLPVFFFISAICAGLAVVMFMSWHSAKAFQRELPFPLMVSMARVLAVVLAFYLALRAEDVIRRGVVGLLFVNRLETWMFLLEIALLFVPMLAMIQRPIRERPVLLYVCSVLVMLGFIANRLNVSITGLEAGSGAHYFPRWQEIMVTLALIANGFFLFYMAARFLPVFEQKSEPARPLPPSHHDVPRPAFAHEEKEHELVNV